MSASPAAVNLQNQWYNTLATAVGGNANFQIVQPNNSVSGLATDDQVWQYFNNLPPASLNNNLTLSGGNQFFANYTGVLSQHLQCADELPERARQLLSDVAALSRRTEPDAVAAATAQHLLNVGDSERSDRCRSRSFGFGSGTARPDLLGADDGA
ncbi:MAG TPA: hypothetical protein VHT93_10005 [Pseudolabrys sp.]|nr:hypothetical protein [Pseudolabrys sp.]